MKNLLFVVLFFPSIIFGQDIVILKSGSSISCKVISLSEKELVLLNQDLTFKTFKRESISIIALDSMTIKKNEIPETVPFSINDIESKNCNSLDKKGVRVIYDNYREILKSDIFFYGYDFKFAKYTNSKKQNLTEKEISESVNYYIENIYNDLNSNLLPSASIERWMYKQGHFFFNKELINSFKKIDDYKLFYTDDIYCFDQKDLEKIISNYRTVEPKGIGMVINIINLNSDKWYVDAFITFFDLESNKIVYLVKSRAIIAPFQHEIITPTDWANGINRAFRDQFIDLIYRPKHFSNEQLNSNMILNE